MCKTKSSLLKKQVSMLKECTAGHEGAVADISCMSIFSACFGPLTSGHNLHMSDLDFLLNSIPFRCKNHFSSLKTKEVIKYFLTKNIFPTAPS